MMITTSSDNDPDHARQRLTSFGHELIEIHDALRAEIAQLHADVNSYLDADSRGRPERPRGLKAHCLAFCSALTLHHTGEDGGAFPVLGREFPELGPVIDKLREDHELIRVVQHGLEQLLDGITDEPDEVEARRVRAELDGISSILESHFRYEERTIVTALNKLPADAGTTEGLLGITTPLTT
ncbi:hemerythrin domain-containing protein [Streptomyces sp. 4N509B]|uniref:hemerythrin domain-containing protein n=1 Tax=Streptomyces sp. 4N509B TaxID=3457413 RepID=UPI003FD34E01